MFVGTWKTRAGALMGIVVAFINYVAMPFFDNDAATVVDWATFSSFAATAIGLLFARDNNVTSEMAGAKGNGLA